MEIRVTEDLDLVKSILMHPSNWPHLVNDDVPQDFEMPEDWLYLVALDPHPVGIFAVHALDDKTVSGHLAMLPDGRGAGVKQATDLVLDFIWKATPAQRVVVNVDEDNVRAVKAAKKCGFVECGRVTHAIRKQGRLLDFIQLEMRRE